MKVYIRCLLCVLLLCTAFAMAGKRANGQGMSVDEWLDGSDDINDEFDTYIEPGGAVCGGTISWNMPGETEETQEGDQTILRVAPTTADVEYVLTIYYTIYALDPYGECFPYSGSTTVTTSMHMTYYINPVLTPDLVCHWVDVGCASGTPACVTSVLVPPPSSSDCNYNQVADVAWLVVNNGCSGYRVVGYVTAPGKCS